MSLDSDVIVDRRRIRRKLTFWRVVAAVVARRRAGHRRRGRDAGGPRRADGIGLDRAGQYRRADPQRPIDGSRRWSGWRSRSAAAVILHINSPGGTTAGSEQLYDCAGAAEGQEAAGRGGRGTGRVRRLHHGDRRRPHRRPAELAGRLDRRAVPVSEFYRAFENRGRQGRGSEILTAEGGSQRLRADQPGGPRRARRAGEGFLCLVPRSGEDSGAAWTTRCWKRSRMDGFSPAARRST